MQELQVKITQAQVEIIDREKFEQNINDVVTMYQNYTVTASTIKDDKQQLANLRKLVKQISDERIKDKKILSKTADEFDEYIKKVVQPLNDIITKIDTDVKEFEAHQKMVRLDTVKAYISNKSAEYMIDPRVFDEKATEYIKASDFMADGMTLKKATMKSLDDMVTFEFQKQQELEKSKSAISGLCAEYGMTDSPYIRMLRDLTLAEVFEQIKADYAFQKEKQELERARQELEQASHPKSTETPKFDPETGEILDGGELSQNEPNALREAENGLKRYTQKMTLEVYFVDTAEKDHFKATLEQAGFKVKHNYKVSGYQRIEPLTQDELNEQCGW